MNNLEESVIATSGLLTLRPMHMQSFSSIASTVLSKESEHLPILSISCLLASVIVLMSMFYVISSVSYSNF